MSTEDFWRSSPRAVYLLFKTRKSFLPKSAGKGRGGRGGPGRRSAGDKGPRLSRLPHP